MTTKKLFLLTLLFIGCSKPDSSSPNTPNVPTTPHVSVNGITYKVNGNLVSIENGVSDQSVSVQKQYSPPFPAVRYQLTGRDELTNFIRFSMITDSLRVQNYSYDSLAFSNGLIQFNMDLEYGGQTSGPHYQGDNFSTIITSLANGKVTGTFSGTFTPFANASFGQKGSVLITEGKINNVPLLY